jgi:hypothetical protein
MVGSFYLISDVENFISNGLAPPDKLAVESKQLLTVGVESGPRAQME